MTYKLNYELKESRFGRLQNSVLVEWDSMRVVAMFSRNRETKSFEIYLKDILQGDGVELQKIVDRYQLIFSVVAGKNRFLDTIANEVTASYEVTSGESRAYFQDCGKALKFATVNNASLSRISVRPSIP